ncbi:hypothetical protein CCH79_00018747 [Gambusia affinis]|uniref:PDEase domain-containing protein n=1 Tax=Gambusia affinis TaxID=33528 RepID=A0A315VAP7_GAMAF|nr:hypothetical protein CCH79_00018747 [Gambusia affinis]
MRQMSSGPGIEPATATLRTEGLQTWGALPSTPPEHTPVVLSYHASATEEETQELQTLCQWVLSVRKNYRKSVAYHNWRHALNTAQCMFALLKSGRLQNNLNDVEILALMIATLCHDLDHRGVNNSYIQRYSRKSERGDGGYTCNQWIYSAGDCYVTIVQE